MNGIGGEPKLKPGCLVPSLIGGASKKRLDAFDFSFQPSIGEKKIRELAALAFLERKVNGILLGHPVSADPSGDCPEGGGHRRRVRRVLRDPCRIGWHNWRGRDVTRCHETSEVLAAYSARGA